MSERKIPFRIESAAPSPVPAGRRRLAFGRARGRRTGVQMRDEGGHLTTFRDLREKADEALLSELAEATDFFRCGVDGNTGYVNRKDVK